MKVTFTRFKNRILKNKDTLVERIIRGELYKVFNSAGPLKIDNKNSAIYYNYEGQPIAEAYFTVSKRKTTGSRKIINLDVLKTQNLDLVPLFMQQLCDAADSVDSAIVVTPDVDAKQLSDLIKFYKTYDFNKNIGKHIDHSIGGTNLTLIRYPRSVKEG